MFKSLFEYLLYKSIQIQQDTDEIDFRYLYQYGYKLDILIDTFANFLYPNNISGPV